MTHPAVLELTRRLLQRGDAMADVDIGEVPAAEYLSEERLAAERRAIFARVPQIVAVEAEVAEPGACLPVELAGAALLLVQGGDGVLRCFKNACRHRATRLVGEGCRKKAIVCPYHGWTYDLAGGLVHVPHQDAFADRCRERDRLIEVPVVARHGMVWASLEPLAPDFLAPVDDELSESAGWTLYRRSEREVNGNWKLIIDAFLDGYHVRHLHRDSIYPFFADARSEAERAGPHIRAVTARRRLYHGPLDPAQLRHLATPSYFLFPNSILILHPDYLSVLVCVPVAVSRTRFVHWMLIPAPPSSEAEERHWAKSFALIDQGVFLREDLFVVEAMQRGLETGANHTVLFGKHEHAAIWFHRALDASLAS